MSNVFSVTPAQVSEARDSIMYGIRERMNWEREHNPVLSDLTSITAFLHRFAKTVSRVDAFTLGFFATHAADFGNVFLSHRRSNACFNVYAMPKALCVGRALNGSALSGDDANDETLAGVVLAMGRGISNGKMIANAVNDYMNRDGKRGTYSSGGTQASSALRALEALGVVREAGRDGSCKLWGIANQERFERLLSAARGIPYNGESVAPDTFDGITLEGTCESVADVLLALPAPVSVETVSVTEAECEAFPMLALPAPTPAPAKRKRAPRKAK